MALKALDEYQDVWGEAEQKAWVNAMETRKAARSVWRKSLHQIDSLTKDQKTWLELAKAELDDKGPMTSRSITENMMGSAPSGVIRSLTPAKMSKLLKMSHVPLSLPRATEDVCIASNCTRYWTVAFFSWTKRCTKTASVHNTGYHFILRRI